MPTQKQLQNLGNAIGYIAVADINGLQQLLSKYGVEAGTDSKTLIDETINLISNQAFYNELVVLLQKNSNASFSGYKSADGTTNKSGFFGGFNLGDLIGTGASIFGTISSNKAKADLLKLQAQQQAQQTQQQIIAGNLLLEQEKLKLAQLQASQEKGSNTLLYVGLGLMGVLLVGVLVYVSTKKK